MGKNSKRQDLLSKDSIKTLQFSAQSLRRAALHPYCLDKLKTCLKPVALCAVSVYFVGLLLMIPLLVLGSLVNVLSAGYVQKSVIADTAKHGLTSAVSLVPFVALVLLRTFIRKPLFKCFIHMLREVNPQVAANIESSPSAPTASRGKSKKASRYINKVVYLLALEVVLHFARKSPWLGRPAVALTHFYTMKKVLGRERAIGLSLFGLIPYFEPWLLKFVQLWRTSNILGQELIVDYVSRYIPGPERSRFYKNHDVDIALFALPGSILLQVPIVGPLAFFPIQASAAFLVDRLDREDSSHLHNEQTNAGSSMATPTRPKGLEPHEINYSQGAPTLPSHPNPVYRKDA